MLTIQIGRRVPRDRAVMLSPDDMVRVLGAGDVLRQVRAADLQPGDVLSGLGIVARVDRMVTA